MPGPLSTPVCLTVIWFSSLSLCLSRAQIWNDEVSDVQYGRLDSNVTLACGKAQPRSPVVWLFNHSSTLPWHRVTSDGSLVLLNVDHSAQGNYSCYDDQRLLLHAVQLRLGHPPGLLSISCRVPNHTHVHCSWVPSVKTFLPAKYNASFRGIGEEWGPCLVDVTQKHCDVYHHHFWQMFHNLRITETNALGSQTTTVRLKLLELVKPDPPESVSAKEVKGQPEWLNISWNFPSSWPLRDAFPLEFHIRYRPYGSMYWSEICSEESPVVVVDALAGHLHQVQVRARDEANADGLWSEWSPQVLVRPWEVDATSEPAEEEDVAFPFNTKPETSTAKSQNAQLEEANVGLLILLVLFSVVILAIILSLILVVWVRQRRHSHVTKQELTAMVKMKSMPI